MSFGARLTEARKRKHLTQDGLGKGLGTDGKDASKAVVYGWEKDQHYPRVDQLVMICEKLDASADWLLFGKEAVNALSPEVAEVALMIEQLPKRRLRDWALRTVRDAVEMARETLQVTPNTVGKQVDRSEEESFREPSRRMRK